MNLFSIQIFAEVHIWCCMRFEFQKGNNATSAIKNICDIYRITREGPRLNK